MDGTWLAPWMWILDGEISPDSTENWEKLFQAALDAGIGKELGLESPLSACKGVREVRKGDMKLNDACPHLTVDPQTYEVHADGELLTCEPATELPLAQRYHLF